MADFAPFRARLRPYRGKLAVLGAVLLASGLAEGLGIGLFYPLIEYAEHGDAFLARDPHAELSRMHIVRRPDDIDPERTPDFVAAYIRAKLDFRRAR